MLSTYTYILFLAVAITLPRCHSVIPVTTCGITFYKKTGTFSPPSFYEPNNTHPQTCKWRISASPDEKITLKITELDTQKTPGCSSGQVEIRDGYWEDSPLLGKYCGEGVLDPVTSTTNKMLISYVHKVGYTGFLANYEAVCGGEIYVRNEFVLHSNDPQVKYPLNRKCIWKVVVPEHHQVVAKFQKFQIEYENHCLFDYVEVYDSDGSSIGRFCGDVLPDNITSTSNTLTVKFVSDASVQREGFSLLLMTEFDECATTQHECAQECINTIGTYRCSCRKGYELHSDGKNCDVGCGGTLKALNGTIHSPSFPHKYPPNKNCTWKIDAPAEHIVLLQFTHFDIEGKNESHSIKEKCKKDKLQFFSESGNVTKRSGTYCGSVLPDPVASEGTSMKIVFLTDDNVEKTGFSLNYSSIRDRCDKFGGNCHHRCVNLITDRKCLCSQMYTALDDFDCKKNCHYEISSTSGTISSPNYPNSYDNHENCTWKFKTTPGHKIQITFLSIESEDCHDYINIYDGYSSNAPILQRLCGSRRVITRTSTNNKLYLNFISDGSNVFKGFKATYSSICGGTYTASAAEQYIYSHETYGLSDYHNNTDCVWIIWANSGYNTSLSVEVFEIEQSDNCEFDFIEIVDGSTSRGKFCGATKPREELLSSANFTVRFHSDSSVSKEGFRLMYKAVRAEEVRVLK